MILIISLPDDNAPYQSRGSGSAGPEPANLLPVLTKHIQTILNYITTNHTDITAALKVTLQ